MNVLILASSYANPYNPLSAPFFRDHAFSLKKVGHNVTVIAVVPISVKEIVRRRKITFGLTRYCDEGVDTLLYLFPAVPKCDAMNSRLRRLFGWRVYKRVPSILERADVLHVHGFAAGTIALQFHRQFRIPFVLTEHSSGFARDNLSLSQQRLAGVVFRRAAVATAVSQDFCALLKRLYDVPFEFVPNPVELPKESQFERSPTALAKQPDSISLLNVAFLDANKRQDRLINAVRRLIDRGVCVDLHIVGDGLQMGRLVALTHALHISDHVVFHGRLPRMKVFSLMRAVDAFALTSDYETFGVVVVEAMASGLPVVATRCGGPESIIEADWMGELAERDVPEVTEALLTLIRKLRGGEYNPERISRHAREVYSYEAVGRRMTQIYSRVLSGTDRPPLDQ